MSESQSKLATTSQAPATSKPWLLLFLATAALWGSSFLFMRIAAVEFGPFATAGMRMAIGTLVMLPLLFWRGLFPQLGQHWRSIAWISLVNAGIPFACFSFAVLHITTGLSAILNATVPMFSAIVGWLWLKQRLTMFKTLGIAIGFLGVALLAGEQATFKGDQLWMSIAAIAACLLATFCYGLSGNVIKERLSHLHPWVIAGGTMLGATLWLAIPAALTWPSVTPSARAWWSLVAVGVLCSAMAYMLFFELLSRTDATKTMSVTYLIPVFAVMYGVLFLDEHVTLWMVGCAVVVLLGTALATGLIQRAAPKASSI
jgi:drug/metabolite transporter (DMT)-like permease